MVIDKWYAEYSKCRKYLYICIKIRTAMAVYMKAIPTLRGEVADRFIKMSEDNLKRRASVDFSREAANSYAILNKKKPVRK